MINSFAPNAAGSVSVEITTNYRHHIPRQYKTDGAITQFIKDRRFPDGNRQKRVRAFFLCLQGWMRGGTKKKLCPSPWWKHPLPSRDCRANSSTSARALLSSSKLTGMSTVGRNIVKLQVRQGAVTFVHFCCLGKNVKICIHEWV